MLARAGFPMLLSMTTFTVWPHHLGSPFAKQCTKPMQIAPRNAPNSQAFAGAMVQNCWGIEFVTHHSPDFVHQISIHQILFTKFRFTRFRFTKSIDSAVSRSHLLVKPFHKELSQTHMTNETHMRALLVCDQALYCTQNLHRCHDTTHH